MTDELTAAFRDLALALEPDMISRRAGPPVDQWVVSNKAGLWVTGTTELEAWTKALEAARKRHAWRAEKVKRKAEARS